MCLFVQSKSEASLVAMDFSGKAGGRVIQNPVEAQSAEREEAQAWRVRGRVGWVEKYPGYEDIICNSGLCSRSQCFSSVFIAT